MATSTNNNRSTRGSEVSHIRDVWLELNAAGSRLGKFLEPLGAKGYDRRRLLHYIKDPGDPDRQGLALDEIPFQDEDGNEAFLSYDEARVLGCVPYYYNYLHNEHGHGPNSVAHMAEDRLDITLITKDEFLDWCYMSYSPSNPKTHVELDVEVQRASWRRRHPDSPLNGPEPGTRRGGSSRANTNTTTVSTNTTSTPKPNTLKKALANYQAITDDSQFEAWSLDFRTTAIAEGTDNVLDASYVPSGEKEERDHKGNSDYILNVLSRHGRTPSIERTVREVMSGNHTYTGQVAWDRVVTYYTKSQRGTNHARKLRTDIHATRFEAKDIGSLHSKMLAWGKLVAEHNSIASAHDIIDDDSKLSKLKDVVENITEFRALEDSIALNLSGATPTSNELLELYETRAMQIDNHADKQKSLPSAIRTVNVAESSFEDSGVNVSNDDLSHVGAYSDGSAAITLDEWEVNVARQKSNRKPWPGTLPDDVWKSLTTDGKGFWRKIPLDDRKRLVALFAGLPMPAPKKDTSFHPSPGSTTYAPTQQSSSAVSPSPSRAVQRHSVTFADSTNRFAAFATYLQDDEDDTDTTNIQSNMLQINHHQRQDDSDSARAVSIMTATTSPVSLATLDEMSHSLPASSLIRQLSTSACTPTSLNESHDTWQYGEESDMTARIKDPGTNFLQKKGLGSKFHQLVQRAKSNTSSPRKPGSSTDISVNMVSIFQLSESPHVSATPMFKARLRHDIPGDPEQPGSEMEHEENVGSNMSESEEGGQDHSNAGSVPGEESNHGNDVTWGRPRPRFEDLLPDSDDDAEAVAPNNNAEGHPMVEQVVLFGELANAVVNPNGLVDAINNERMVEGYHIDLPTADEYDEKYRAMVVPSELCNKGIAGRGTELIAWNDPPEHVDIITPNGYILTRARVGSFRNVGAYTVSGEVDIVYHNFMSVPYGTTIIPINQVEDEGHAVRYDMPLFGSRSIITVDEAGDEHRLHLIEHRGMPWLPARQYRDGEEEERQQLVLTNPTPYARPTAVVRDIIEDIVYEERTSELKIPLTLQEALLQDSDNGNTKWWDVYIRAFTKAFERDGASWTGTNRVQNIDIRFNYTSRNNSLSHRCRVHVTHQPDEAPGHLPPVISYDIIQHMRGHKVRTPGDDGEGWMRIVDIRAGGEDIMDEQRSTLGRGPTVYGHAPQDIQVVLQPIPRTVGDEQVLQVVDGDINLVVPYPNINEVDRREITEEACARLWGMYYHRHVMDELTEVISRAHVEVGLYRRHMGIEIGSTWITFYLRYRKLIHGARANQLRLLAVYHEASKGKKNNTRIKLNGRIRSMLPIYDMIARYVLVADTPIVIRDQLREIHRPHTLMIHPTLLAFLQLYGYGYNVIIEGLMYGEASRYELFHEGFLERENHGVRSNRVGQDAEDPVSYQTLFAYTSIPYYQETGWNSSSDDSASEDEMQVERELAPHIIRLRVIAAERPPQREVVEDHMDGDDQGAQVEEDDAEWNAMAIANIADAMNIEVEAFDINELYASEGDGYVYSDDEENGENQPNNEMND